MFFIVQSFSIFAAAALAEHLVRLAKIGRKRMNLAGHSSEARQCNGTADSNAPARSKPFI
jgi:hypothetical protein